jgi:serine/threonine-protein kinase
MASSEFLDQLQSTLGSAYTVERELGGGGMSRVFAATETALGRRVVIKVLPSELGAGVSVERFRREIQLAASLQHPLIVPLISAGSDKALLYYTMPLIEGESLRARVVREGELPIADVLRILRDVAEALSYAHEHGVVHRDIKPDNVLLTKHHALVTDFGVAKALSAAASTGSETSAGIALGTPAYMAPEQAAADPHTDHRADIYALGVLAYEMLCGRPPFVGATPQSVLAAHVTTAPDRSSAHRPSVPAALDALVSRCLEKKPADRPQTAEEVLEDLMAIGTPGRGSTPASTLPTTRTRHALRIGLVSAGVIASAMLIAKVMTRRFGPASPEGITETSSVAVLPFENVGGDTANLYFADGMTDELAAALTRVPRLQVAARSSAYSFRGKQVSAQEIGRQLRVSRLVEGSVRRSGSRLRLTAQLVNATNGLTLWSDSYEREVTDVFRVQDELAHAIAGTLRQTLGGEASDAAVRAPRGTEDLEAYDLFLQGRFFWAKRGEASLQRAIALFQRAISRDPSFARAHAGLSLCYGILPSFSNVSADSVIQLALASAERAVALDSTLADAHIALAAVKNAQLKWTESDSEYRGALVLDSTNATVHQWYSALLFETGHPDQALAHSRRALELDPLSPIIANQLVFSLNLSRRFNEAIEVAHRGLALDSTLTELWMNLAESQLFAGHPDSALRAEQRALDMNPNGAIELANAAYMQGMAGDRRRAEVLLRTIRQRFARGESRAYDLAVAQLGLGRSDSALAWLATSVERREYAFVDEDPGCDPAFDPLKPDQRFSVLIRSTGMSVCPPGPPLTGTAAARR